MPIDHAELICERCPDTAAAEAAPAIAESEPTTQEGVPHLLVRECDPGDHLRGTSPRCSPKP